MRIAGEERRRRRRTSEEFLYSILLAMKGGARSTWIMYAVNTSWAQKEKYMRGLLKNELAEKSEDGMFFLTQKGKALLGMLEEYMTERSKLLDDQSTLTEINDRIKRCEQCGTFRPQNDRANKNSRVAEYGTS